MTKDEFVAHMKETSWSTDRFGHFQRRVLRGDQYQKWRIKIQATSCRIEVSSSDDTEWIRVGGDYYKNIPKLEDGRIRVGSYMIGRKKDT